MTSSVRRGRAWGRRQRGPAELEITGDDAALGALARARPGVRVRFRPDGSDLARALGLTDQGPSGDVELPVDGLALEAIALKNGPGMAVNAVVLGEAPDRLRWTTPTFRAEVTVDGRTRFEGEMVAVVVASGQYLRGADLVPRGHPGDGRAEVQVYALRRGERRAMRRRLGTGTHVPHPRIRELAGREIEVRAARSVPLEVDGHPEGRVAAVGLEVIPAAAWVVL
ncbi:MAG: hypothetical protein L0206_09775 [Actinobacteria bacterium]|nr:hypothetical protein [Actinomycetota bacterium]